MIKNLFGKLWAFPVTLIGVGCGVACALYGYGFLGNRARIRFCHNAIAFEHLPLGVPESALTLGNCILSTADLDEITVPTYDHSSRVWIGRHEEAHTYQYEILGIFFIPLWLWFGGEKSENPLEYHADLWAGGTGSWWPSWHKKAP